MGRIAVIFDLDGTITRPFLDFDAIRREMGLPKGLPILEAIGTLDAPSRTAAEAVLDRHEQAAAEQSTTHDGAREAVERLRGHGCPVAILTRNTRKWTTFVLDKHGIVVDAIRCREDGAVKPSPQPVLELCHVLVADPAASWMVGDHRFDLESGRDAGSRTILMLGDREDMPTWADLADHIVRSFAEIPPLILPT